MTSKDNCGPASDRELLEMAAKAAGYDVSWHHANQCWMITEIKGELKWNSLDDDGDALRLAVSIPGLNLQWIIAEAWQAHDDNASHMAYARRAIVRAAAAIGSAM